MSVQSVGGSSNTHQNEILYKQIVINRNASVLRVCKNKLKSQNPHHLTLILCLEYTFFPLLAIIKFKFKMTEEYSEDLQQKIEDYLAKMEEIAENKNFLSLRYFEEAESLVRNEVLQSHQQSDSLPLLQKALISLRNEMYSRNQTAISKWCNQLLSDSIAAVDKKICREIKSLTTYRQEILTTVQLLRKKTEPYLTMELSLLIQDVLLQKIFEHVGQLHSSVIGQLQDQFKVLEIQNKALGVECREAKRRTNKEDSEAQRTISQLREKLSFADVKFSLLQQTTEELRQELHLCQESKDETLQKINEEYNTQLFQLRAQVEQLQEQTQEAMKKSTYLEMELQKEQLLHKQTMLHYQQLISDYHSKEEVLKEEILQASRVSQKEIDTFRLLSTRKLEDWQQTANDLKEQLDSTQKTLKNKQSEVLSLRQTLVTFKQTSRAQIDDLIKKNTQLEYRNKVLQDKESQCEQLRLRLQKIDNQLKRVQMDRDQLNQHCKEIEKQRLIAQQKHQYLKVELEQEQAKIVILTDQLQFEKQQNEAQNLINKKEMISRSVQTDEDVHRQKLKTALALIRQMESDYLRLQQSVMRKTYM